jgi:two-component system response regulator AtoC
MAGILIIDDEPVLTDSLRKFFERAGSHTVTVAHTGEDGLAAFDRWRPDVVLLDMFLPDMTGFGVLERLRHEDPVVIIITGGADVPMAVEAMQSGAENFLTKPVDLPHLAALVEKGVEKARLRRVSRYFSARRGGSARGLLGSSPTMRELTRQIEQLADSDRTTVLLLGESGTGKGLVAEFIHAHSPRAARAFVEVNCAAFPAAMLEAELFGTERASPGGRDVRETQVGQLEMADGGTLFLDEIGELDTHLQPKLLRVLEGKPVRRQGGTEEFTAHLRLIAATNRDLVNEVTAGRFREDLYYRLSVMPVNLPPLRARSRDDLLELIANVSGELHPQLPDAPPTVSDAALERLLKYSWPGNIRELRNVLERAMIMARGATQIGPEHLPMEVRDASGSAVEHYVPRTLAEVERTHIERTLAAHQGNRTHAARELGISRATLIKKIREYGLAPSPRAGARVPSTPGT